MIRRRLFADPRACQAYARLDPTPSLKMPPVKPADLRGTGKMISLHTRRFAAGLLFLLRFAAVSEFMDGAETAAGDENRIPWCVQHMPVDCGSNSDAT